MGSAEIVSLFFLTPSRPERSTSTVGVMVRTTNIGGTIRQTDSGNYQICFLLTIVPLLLSLGREHGWFGKDHFSIGRLAMSDNRYELFFGKSSSHMSSRG